MLVALLRAFGAWLRSRALAPKPSPPAQPSDLAARVAAAMRRYGYDIAVEEGEINIVYVEGLGPDGIRNANAPNQFNDLRVVISFVDGRPRILGRWEATTEPGRRYTERPLPGVDGAARIAFGQYRAWQVGIHRAGKPAGHEALVQTGGPVTVCRDVKRDYRRDGDRRTSGFYGINQHHGYDLPAEDIGAASAGCLVGREVKGHRDFMALVKSDPRLRADPRHVFTTVILPATEVV